MGASLPLANPARLGGAAYVRLHMAQNIEPARTKANKASMPMDGSTMSRAMTRMMMRGITTKTMSVIMLLDHMTAASLGVTIVMSDDVAALVGPWIRSGHAYGVEFRRTMGIDSPVCFTWARYPSASRKDMR